MLLIAGGDGAATLQPALQVGQLHVEHRCLDGVEAAVVTEGRVQVAARHAVHRQLTHGLGQAFVAAGERTAIPCAAEVLGGEEAEAAHIAPAAHGLAGPAGAGGLGAVFHHLEAVALGDGAHPRHVHRAAEQVHRDEGLGGRGDRRFRLIQIDQVAGGIYIHEHGGGAHGADRLGGGEEAEGGGDHLIPRPDAQAAQRQNQGIGAAVAAHGVGHTHRLREGRLELGDRTTADVLAAAQHPQHGLVEVLAERVDLLAEAERGHLHGGNLKLPDQRAQCGPRPRCHFQGREYGGDGVAQIQAVEGFVVARAAGIELTPTGQAVLTVEQDQIVVQAARRAWASRSTRPVPAVHRGRLGGG